MNPWISHCKSYHASHPSLKWSEVLKAAKSSYSKKQKGTGLFDSLKSLHQKVKDNKVISRVASAIAPHAGKHAELVNRIGSVAGQLGNGLHPVRRRRIKKL